MCLYFRCILFFVFLIVLHCGFIDASPNSICFHPLAREKLSPAASSRYKISSSKAVISAFPSPPTLFHKRIYSEFKLSIDHGIYIEKIIGPNFEGEYDSNNFVPFQGGEENIYNRWHTDMFYHLQSSFVGKKYIIGLLERAKCAPAGTPPLVLHYLRSTFSDELRPAVCGDGIVSPGESCEFQQIHQFGEGSDDMVSPQVAMFTPPMHYHCKYGERGGCWRECRWGPLIAGACNSGMETRNIFLHYCGNGIVELETPSIDFLKRYQHRYQSLMPHALICGYEDPFMTIPVFCNLGDVNPGHHYLFLDGAMEECDLGSELNGNPEHGCTSDCKLKCINGVPNYASWPALPCIQPCLKPGFTGMYCDKPRCLNGIINWEDGSCLSCHAKEHTLPYCEGGKPICGGHGEPLPNGHECKCHSGWMGPNCERSTCLQWQNAEDALEANHRHRWCAKCEAGWSGPQCLQSTCQHGMPSPSNDKCICYHEIFDGDFCQETGCMQPVLVTDHGITPIIRPLGNGPLEYANAACYGTLCIRGRSGEFCSIHVDVDREEDYLSGTSFIACNEQAGEIDILSPDGRCIDPCWRNPLFFGMDCFKSNGLFLKPEELSDHESSASVVPLELIWAQSCMRGWSGPICLESLCPTSTPEMTGCKGKCPPGFLGAFCHIPICITTEENNSLLPNIHNDGDDDEGALSTEHIPWWSKIASLWGREVARCSHGCNADALSLMTSEELDQWCGSSLAISCFTNGVGPTTKDGCGACRKGFFGPWCTMQGYENAAEDGDPASKSCRFPYWGTFCTLVSSNCDLQHTDRIDRITGDCICKEGWKGSICTEPLCVNGRANPATGYCIECNEGWEGANCNIPRCKFGFIRRSDEIRVDHISESGMLLPFPPVLVAIESLYERDYFGENLMRIWRLFKGVIDPSPILGSEDGRCSACYHQLQKQQDLQNESKASQDDGHQDPTEDILYCELDYGDLPCYHGFWDAKNGHCGPCFPGFWGPSCNESHCESWDRLYVSCAKCVPITKRFGPLCQWISRCKWGIPDLYSGSGACQEGIPCTHEDARGPFCQIDISIGATDEEFAHRLPRGNFQNHKLGLCKAGWRGPDCFDLACEHGLPNMTHPLFHCYDATCVAGWMGPYCDQPLLVQQRHDFPKILLRHSSNVGHSDTMEQQHDVADEIPLSVLEIADWIEILLANLRKDVASIRPDWNGNIMINHSTGEHHYLVEPVSPNVFLEEWSTLVKRRVAGGDECLHPGMAGTPYCNFSLCSRRGGVPSTFAQLALAQSQEDSIIDPNQSIGCQCNPGFSGPYCERWACAQLLDATSMMLDPSKNLILRYFPESLHQLIHALLTLGEAAIHSTDALYLLQEVDVLFKVLIDRLHHFSLAMVLEGEQLQPLLAISSGTTSWLPWGQRSTSKGCSILESLLEALKLEAAMAIGTSPTLLEHRMASLERQGGDILPPGFMNLLGMLVFSKRTLKEERLVFKLVEYHLTETLFDIIPEAQQRIFPIDDDDCWKQCLESTLLISYDTKSGGLVPLRCLPGGVRVQRIAGANDLFLVTTSVVEPENIKNTVIQQSRLTAIRQIMKRSELLGLNPDFSDALLISTNEDYGQCSFCRHIRISPMADDAHSNEFLEIIHGTLEMPFCRETMDHPLPTSPMKPIMDPLYRMGIPLTNERGCPPGFYGADCQRHWCLKWNPDHNRCLQCTPGRHGHLCQWASHCIHGKLDQESEDGACKIDEMLGRSRCDPPHYFGRFCNETRCVIPDLGIPDDCSHGCMPGWQTLPIPGTEFGQYCDIPICVHGIPDLDHGYCRENSCNPPFWGGKACDVPHQWCPTPSTPEYLHSGDMEVQLKPPWRPGYASIVVNYTCRPCPPGWTGAFCHLPLCIHGFPDLEHGGCKYCHEGWVESRTCDEPVCQHGIFNPKAVVHKQSSKAKFFPWQWNDYLLASKEPLCLACLGDWFGPDCSIPGCDPASAMDPLTQRCFQCPPGQYGPKCARIARCVHGILDEHSLDGSCLSGSCRIGRGRFCDASACLHGQTDIRTLFCSYCYQGWISSDPSRPRCDVANCKNGRLMRKEGPYSHAFECICMPEFEGPACDIKKRTMASEMDLATLCPLPKCDPIPLLNCFGISLNNGTDNGTMDLFGLGGASQVIVRERKCVTPPEGFPMPGKTRGIIRILEWMKNVSSEPSSMGITFKGDNASRNMEQNSHHSVLMLIIAILVVIIMVLLGYIFIHGNRWCRITNFVIRGLRSLFGGHRDHLPPYKGERGHVRGKEAKTPICTQSGKPRRNSISTPYQLNKRRPHVN